MREKGLIFMTANPFHNGHMGLIKRTLQETEEVDVYVGQRERPWTLPHAVRMASIHAAMERQHLESRVRLLSTTEEIRGSILNIGPEGYDLLAMGSDVANMLAPGGKLRDYEREHFLSFPHCLVVQRDDFRLTQAAQTAILARIPTLEVGTPVSTLQATHIRKGWSTGQDIRPSLPEGVWEIIAPHVLKFSNVL